MSKRLSGRIFLGNSFYKKTAIASILIASTAVSGCVSLDRQSAGNYAIDQLTTSSLNTETQANLNQALPDALPASGNGVVQVASSGFSQPKYLPPASIGNIIKTQNSTLVGTQVNNVVSSNLPNLTPTPTLGSNKIMPAQTVMTQTPTAPAPVVANIVKPAPALENAYIHVVQSGESLYSIARKYNVSVNSIVSANNMTSANIIGVGQKIGIPGREDLLAKQAQTKLASLTPIASAPKPATAPIAARVAPATRVAPAAPVAQAPVKPQVAAIAPVANTSNDKFRWPVSGKLITDFAGSKGTGINISAAKGTPVKSAENGTIIYVGDAVEGYGNLILIKHNNGYVSAYAHLDSASVSKGDVVKRGDLIGAVGQSGSVTSSQLHFEIRKGATPVDPIPMLAS